MGRDGRLGRPNRGQRLAFRIERIAGFRECQRQAIKMRGKRKGKESVWERARLLFKIRFAKRVGGRRGFAVQDAVGVTGGWGRGSDFGGLSCFIRLLGKFTRRAKGSDFSTRADPGGRLFRFGNGFARRTQHCEAYEKTVENEGWRAFIHFCCR